MIILNLGERFKKIAMHQMEILEYFAFYLLFKSTLFSLKMLVIFFKDIFSAV